MSPVEQELQPITRNTKFKPEDESKNVIAEPKSNNRVKVKKSPATRNSNLKMKAKMSSLNQNLITGVPNFHFQITVGLTLIVFRHKINTPYDHKERPRYIKRIDNLILAGVFLVTILNVFIATFTTFGDKILHYPPSR
ncbi:uncharacterized protein LOC113469262 [Diaphorina citri]|uniref:Uncharacterized protein LOC113469262 n=1 Tax=Diaphorina citri TaxID=121845 RepID=A0A3Q0J2H0_DIACI|nr:uncharacterized protein LOC113469262 [Diaphorina citri]